MQEIEFLDEGIDKELFNLEWIAHYKKNVTYRQEYFINCWVCKFNVDLNIDIVNKLVDYIAFDIQSNNDIEIEQYNFYLFIIADKTEVEIKNHIEKDTYCMKKIVVNRALEEENLDTKHKEELFKIVENKLFNIPKNQNKNNELILEKPIYFDKVYPQDVDDKKDPQNMDIDKIVSIINNK